MAFIMQKTFMETELMAAWVCVFGSLNLKAGYDVTLCEHPLNASWLQHASVQNFTSCVMKVIGTFSGFILKRDSTLLSFHSTLLFLMCHPCL